MELGAVWFAAYLATQSTVTFWKDFAVTERGFTDAQVGGSISIAAVVALPLVFTMTRLLDVLGRRRSTALVFGLGSLASWGCYTLQGRGPLTVALVFGIFAASASTPILNALSTELFPTEIRAQGFAWANNVLGRVALVVSPLVVGHLAQRLGWGPVVRSTAIFNLVTIALVYWLLPETKGRSLEETAAL
jgi:putative MFS transporter